MKAIIMAGGEGSRLRPLTCDCPKPMLPLMGKPMMEYALQLLKSHGISDIAATLGYLPEAIIDYFGDGSSLGVQMRYYTEKTPLGTAGSVLQARDFLNQRFIVLSGDGIADFDLSAALRFHRENNALATLLLAKCVRPQEYGMVVTAENGRILSFHEKPGRSDIYSDLVNTGIYILEKEILEMIPPDKPWDFGRDLFPALLQEGLPVYGYAAEGYWCDVGDPAAYLQVHRDALDGKIRLPGLRANADGPAFIHPGATIESGACIGAYSVIGANCRIAAGAGVKHSLLLEGTEIGPGAQLRGCICAPGSIVEENARLFEGSVVGSGSRIGKRATLPPEIKIWPGKHIPEGERPDCNIVWGSPAGERFDGSAMLLSSPGQTARCVQACMEELGAQEVIIAREDAPAADALWHAAASAAMAQGLRVMDAGICCLPQLRFLQRSLHASPALLVKADRLLPLDAQGCPLSEKRQRNVLKLMQRQDYACPFHRRTLPLVSLGNMQPAYAADTAAIFPGDVPEIVLCGQGAVYDLAEAALARSGVPCRRDEASGSGEITVRFSPDGERAEIAGISEVERQLACAWTAMQLGEERLLLPLHFTRATQHIGADAVFLSGETAVWMEALARQSPLQFRLHTDGPFFLVQFLHALAQNGLTLPQWRSRMPGAYRSAASMDLPDSESAALLHRLADISPDTELGGGMRLKRRDGWAWLHPDAGRLEIFAEAASMEAAGEICAFYEGEIRRLRNGQD